MTFVHLVADYGIGDPAFGEVMQRLYALKPELSIMPTSVPKFDTLATGFWIYQYGMNTHPEGMIVYSNTAPRKDRKQAREDNAGEKLLYAKLRNGVEVVAVNAGYCFAFIKPEIETLRSISVENKGSQFRSRDFFPPAVVSVATDKSLLGEELSTESLPDVPTNRVMWFDGYGNIKTTIRKSSVQFEPGTKVSVAINKVKRTALVAGGNFHVAEGELSYSPGSSGHNDPFMELFLRGGSAQELFELDKSGTKITFEES